MVQNEAILIELDTLLDSRLGTIDLLNPAWADALVKASYQRRISDDFDKFVPEIDMNAYRDRYANRDWEVLAHAAPTEFSTDLKRILDELLFDPKRITPNSTTELQVNTYPYDFSDSEKVELVDSLQEITATVFSIKLVTIPPYTITLDLIKANNWVAIFTYDLDLLLKNMLTVDSIRGKVRCNEVMVYAPQLTINYQELRKTVEETEASGNKFEPFIHMSLICSPFIALEFVGSEYYSLADFKKHALTEELEKDLYSEETDENS